jgi:hypothetical protein
MSYKTKQEYAKSILKDEAILEQFKHSKNISDYEKVTENIIAKYEMMKVLR